MHFIQIRHFVKMAQYFVIPRLQNAISRKYSIILIDRGTLGSTVYFVSFNYCTAKIVKIEKTLPPFFHKNRFYIRFFEHLLMANIAQ